MGSWGPGTFENDEALDLLGKLLQSEDYTEGVTLIRDALLGVVGPRTYPPDNWEFWKALGAAEVVAAAGGQPCGSSPTEMTDWLTSRSPRFDWEIFALARAAVDQALADAMEQAAVDYEHFEVPPDALAGASASMRSMLALYQDRVRRDHAKVTQQQQA